MYFFPDLVVSAMSLLSNIKTSDDRCDSCDVIMEMMKLFVSLPFASRATTNKFKSTFPVITKITSPKIQFQLFDVMADTWMYVSTISNIVDTIVQEIDGMNILTRIFGSISSQEGCQKPYSTGELPDYFRCNQMRAMKNDGLVMLFLGAYFILSVTYYIIKAAKSIKSGFRQINTSINSNNSNVLNRVSIEGGSNFIPIPERISRFESGHKRVQV